MAAHETIQMPVKARVILEGYKDCLVRTTSTISWSAMAQYRTDEEAITRAREIAKRDLITAAVYTLGKDQLEALLSQDMEGFHIVMKAMFFNPRKFEEMITAIYTAGVIEGRKNAT